MKDSRWRRWRVIALLPVVLLGAIALSLALGAGPALAARVPTGSAAIAGDCTGPVAGRYVYDCAGLLTTAEVADLETQAAAVVRAGAPTVVYLQVRAATADQALQDAIDLMQRWNVESRPGAHDGFVMFFDLQPGNLRHGQVALYAGAKHYHGNLPQSELDHIRTEVMTPLLADGKTAAGIAAGLQQVAHDLRYGLPPPPGYRAPAAAFGRVPFNVLAALFAAVVGLLVARVARQAPPSGAGDEAGLGSLATPGDLSPAVAGALVRGRVGDAQMEAAMLDFARRGLLEMEPAGKDKVRVRLLKDGAGLTGYEQELWNGLAARADPMQHTLSNADLAQVRQGWGWAKDLLRRELVERGWYDPAAAAAQRRPLYIAGAVGMVAAAAALVVVALASEGWALIGMALFLAAGSAAFVRGYAVPDTTVEGQLAAAPWRGYAASVTAREYEPNLDTDLPYIVGLGLLSKLTARLKAASERGYAPSWFRAPGGQVGMGGTAVAFYPYWAAFHGSVAPSSASGGAAGAGAAAGGGGSAGSF